MEQYTDKMIENMEMMMENYKKGYILKNDSMVDSVQLLESYLFKEAKEAKTMLSKLTELANKMFDLQMEDVGLLKSFWGIKSRAKGVESDDFKVLREASVYFMALYMYVLYLSQNYFKNLQTVSSKTGNMVSGFVSHSVILEKTVDLRNSKLTDFWERVLPIVFSDDSKFLKFINNKDNTDYLTYCLYRAFIAIGINRNENIKNNNIEYSVVQLLDINGKNTIEDIDVVQFGLKGYSSKENQTILSMLQSFSTNQLFGLIEFKTYNFSNFIGYKYIDFEKMPVNAKSASTLLNDLTESPMKKKDWKKEVLGINKKFQIEAKNSMSSLEIIKKKIQGIESIVEKRDAVINQLTSITNIVLIEKNDMFVDNIDKNGVELLKTDLGRELSDLIDREQGLTVNYKDKKISVVKNIFTKFQDIESSIRALGPKISLSAGIKKWLSSEIKNGELVNFIEKVEEITNT